MATSPTDELRAKNALLQSESATFEEEEDSAIFNDEAISEDFHDSEEAEDSFEKAKEIEELLQHEELQSNPSAENEDAGEEELETTAAEAPEKLKIARSKKTPSRYNDCMLDLSDIADPLVEEEVQSSYKKVKSVKFALEPSQEKDGPLDQLDASSPAPTSDKEETIESSFDPDGNFRFKLGKEHIIKSRTGGLNTYRCDVCEMIFPRSFSLRRHYERIHINPRFVRNKGKKDQEMVKNLIDNDRKNVFMKMQKDAAEDMGLLVANENRAASDNAEDDSKQAEDPSFYIYACKLCSRYQIFFKTKEQLRRHYQTRHTVAARLKAAEVFKCDTCERSYHTRHELHRHRRIHSGERPYPCRFCGKRFPTSTNARRHERTHTGDKPHICKVCGKGFIQKTDMAKHLRTVHRLRFSRKKFVNNPEEGDCLMEDNEAHDSSNQFEENIDFAAYLNLDKFEKGSLMGGSEVEAQFLNSSPSSSGTLLVGRKNPEPEEDSQMQRSGPKEEQEEVSYKCPECSKSFNSQVNMRRHFRLKHERNKVKSLFPVSMVVKKYKIKESSEAELKDDFSQTASNDSSPKAAAKLNPINATTSAKSPYKVVTSKAVSNVSLDSSKSDSSCSSLGLKALSKETKQQGSKLGLILERLTMKKANEAKSVDTNRTPPKKENLISSNTLLESMQHAKKKAQLSRQDNASKTSQNFSSMQKSKDKDSNRSDPELLFRSGNQSLNQVVMDKIRRDEIKMRQTLNEDKLRSYMKSKMFRQNPSFSSGKMFSAFRSGLSPRGAERRGFSGNSFMANSDRPRSFFKDGNEFLKRDFDGGRSSRFTPMYNSTKDSKKSFLDTCWNRKINDIAKYKRGPKESSPWQSLERSHASRSLNPAPFDPSFSIKDSPLDFKLSSLDSKLVDSGKSGNSPLDLTKKTPKSVEDFSVNGDGVLDLSTGIRSNRNSEEDENLERKELMVNKEFSSDLSQYQSRRMDMHSIFEEGDRLSGSRSDSRNILDAREMKFGANSNIPLKFHAVKFGKNGQCHSSGTAGRPPKSFTSSGQYRKFPHGMDSSRFSDPLPHQMMKSNPHSAMPSRDSMFSHRTRLHSHNFSPYKKHSREHRPYPLGNSSSISPSDVFRMSDGSFPSLFHHQRPVVRNPYPDASNFAHSSKGSRSSSFLKQSGSDPDRRWSHELTSMMDSKASGSGLLHSSSRSFMDDFDRDVMKRCIRKAQHDLDRKTASEESSKKVFELPDEFDKDMMKRCIGKAQHQLKTSSRSSGSTAAANVLQGKIKEEAHDRTSPFAFNMAAQKQAADARSKLTMTPGFDTNGDDSSRDDDIQPQNTSRSSQNFSRDFTTENETRTVSAFKQSLFEKVISCPTSCTRRLNIPSKLKEGPPKSKQSFVDSLANKLVQQNLSKMATDRSIDVKANIENTSERSMDPKNNENEKADDNSSEEIPDKVRLCKEADSPNDKSSNFKMGPKEHIEDKQCDYPPSPNLVAPKKESVFQPIKSPTSDADDSPSTPKKFVQKIKLRAIKTQDKDGTKKWTLVGDISNCSDSLPQPAKAVEAGSNIDENNGSDDVYATVLSYCSSTSPKQNSLERKLTSSEARQSPSSFPKNEMLLEANNHNILALPTTTTKALNPSIENTDETLSKSAFYISSDCQPSQLQNISLAQSPNTLSPNRDEKPLNRDSKLPQPDVPLESSFKTELPFVSHKPKYKETCLISDQTDPSFDIEERVVRSIASSSTTLGQRKLEHSTLLEPTETSLVDTTTLTPSKDLENSEGPDVLVVQPTETLVDNLTSQRFSSQEDAEKHDDSKCGLGEVEHRDSQPKSSLMDKASSSNLLSNSKNVIGNGETSMLETVAAESSIFQSNSNETLSLSDKTEESIAMDDALETANETTENEPLENTNQHKPTSSEINFNYEEEPSLILTKNSIATNIESSSSKIPEQSSSTESPMLHKPVPTPNDGEDTEGNKPEFGSESRPPVIDDGIQEKLDRERSEDNFANDTILSTLIPEPCDLTGGMSSVEGTKQETTSYITETDLNGSCSASPAEKRSDLLDTAPAVSTLPVYVQEDTATCSDTSTIMPSPSMFDFESKLLQELSTSIPKIVEDSIRTVANVPTTNDKLVSENADEITNKISSLAVQTQDEKMEWSENVEPFLNSVASKTHGDLSKSGEDKEKINKESAFMNVDSTDKVCSSYEDTSATELTKFESELPCSPISQIVLKLEESSKIIQPIPVTDSSDDTESSKETHFDLLSEEQNEAEIRSDINLQELEDSIGFQKENDPDLPHVEKTNSNEDDLTTVNEDDLQPNDRSPQMKVVELNLSPSEEKQECVLENTVESSLPLFSNERNCPPEKSFETLLSCEEEQDGTFTKETDSASHLPKDKVAYLLETSIESTAVLSEEKLDIISLEKSGSTLSSSEQTLSDSLEKFNEATLLLPDEKLNSSIENACDSDDGNSLQSEASKSKETTGRVKPQQSLRLKNDLAESLHSAEDQFNDDEQHLSEHSHQESFSESKEKNDMRKLSRKLIRKKKRKGQGWTKPARKSLKRQFRPKAHLPVAFPEARVKDKLAEKLDEIHQRNPLSETIITSEIKTNILPEALNEKRPESLSDKNLMLMKGPRSKKLSKASFSPAKTALTAEKSAISKPNKIVNKTLLSETTTSAQTKSSRPPGRPRKIKIQRKPFVSPQEKQAPSVYTTKAAKLNLHRPSSKNKESGKGKESVSRRMDKSEQPNFNKFTTNAKERRRKQSRESSFADNNTLNEIHSATSSNTNLQSKKKIGLNVISGSKGNIKQLIGKKRKLDSSHIAKSIKKKNSKQENVDAQQENSKKRKRAKSRSFEAPFKGAADVVKSSSRGRKMSKKLEKDTLTKAEASQLPEPNSTTLSAVKSRIGQKKLKQSFPSAKDKAKQKKFPANSNKLPVRRSIRNFTKCEVVSKSKK